MLINLLVLTLTFSLIGRLLKPRLSPSESFLARWVKAYLVALLAIPAYLLIVSAKEYVLFQTVYEEMIEVQNVPAGQILAAIISATLWPAIYGFLFGPLIMAMTGWNRPPQTAVET